jgi:hypothetical protein
MLIKGLSAHDRTKTMTMFRKIGVLAAPALALLALSGCATPFKADVARFQQLPATQGQTFTVVADDTRLAGGLEFGQYANLVTARLTQLGYRPATDPASSDMVVRMRYMVDNGREKVRSTGFGDPWGYGPFGYGRFGGGWGYPGFYGRRYAYGFYDPFLFGPGYNDVSSYTVYTSQLELKIDRTDGKRVFEGTASAQSLSNKLTYLVPNLIEAMFTNFPGQSGETIKITVPPEPKA